MAVTFANMTWAALALFLAHAGAEAPERMLRTGNESVGTPPVSVPPSTRPPATVQPAPNVTTGAVVRAMTSATRFCRSLRQTEYVVDCLAERLDNVSRRLARTSGNEEAAAALAGASRSLNRIARENRAPDRPRATFASPQEDGQRNARPLIPIAPGQQDAALADAVAVIEETETILLRAAIEAPADAGRLSEIADAVALNKVMLRSL